MKTVYKDSAKAVTLKHAIAAYRYGIATIINDGKDITLELEEMDYEGNKK